MTRVIVQQSPIHGLGVFASRGVSKGEIVLPIDDSRVITDQHPLDASKDEFAYHCDYLAGGKVTLMRFPERYINHSCDPNSFVRTLLGVRYVFALRQISSGEEITYDYCINGFGDTLWECTCGSARCRKTIHSDFFHLPHDLQVEYLPSLDSWYIEEYKDKVEALIRRIKDSDA